MKTRNGCEHFSPHGTRRYNTRHCLRCGELINPQRAANPDCSKKHPKLRDLNDHCGDCGTKLMPDR